LPIIAFFDLITFFGAGALFSWLAFAPLLRDQLEPFLGLPSALANTARNNFATLNDHFLVSFVFFSIAASSDYLFRNPSWPYYQNGFLRLFIGGGFFAGLVTLITPMLCLRSIVRGTKSWVDINPPTWGWVVLIASITGVLTYQSFFQISAEKFVSEEASLLGFAWFLTALFTMVGGYVLILHERDTKVARGWLALLGLPFIVAFELWILSVLFHFLHLE